MISSTILTLTVCARLCAGYCHDVDQTPPIARRFYRPGVRLDRILGIFSVALGNPAAGNPLFGVRAKHREQCAQPARHQRCGAGRVCRVPAGGQAERYRRGRSLWRCRAGGLSAHLYAGSGAQCASGRAVQFRSPAAAHLVAGFPAEGFHTACACGRFPQWHEHDMADPLHVAAVAGDQCDLRREARDRPLSERRLGAYPPEFRAGGDARFRSVRRWRCLHSDEIGVAPRRGCSEHAAQLLRQHDGSHAGDQDRRVAGGDRPPQQRSASGCQRTVA